MVDDVNSILVVGSYGLVIRLDGKAGSIVHGINGHDPSVILYGFTMNPVPEDGVLDLAFDVIESLALAHACAGIAVDSRAYGEGVDVAIDTLLNKLS